MKAENIVSFGIAVKAMFDNHYDGVTGMDSTLGGDWEEDVFVVQMMAADGLVGVDGMRGESKAQTRARNKWMRKMRLLLILLKFKIEKCIEDGSITDSLYSFGLGTFFRGIGEGNIKLFHVAFMITYSRVTSPANRAALIAAGFSAAKITSIKTIHDKAWGLNVSKIKLKGAIGERSKGNVVVRKRFLATCQRVIEATRLYGVMIGDKKLQKRATVEALVSTFTPKQEKKMRERLVKRISHFIYQTDMVAKDIMKFIVRSKSRKSLFIVRSDRKSGPFEGGMELEWGVEYLLKLKMIPGTGRYIIIYNPYVDDDGVIGCLIIKGA